MTSSTKRRFLTRLAALGIAAITVASFAAGEDDFRAAYEAYVAASADGRHAEAAAHAEQAKRLGETLFAEGWVQTEFDVDESGFVRDARVVESAGGDGFEAAALDAVRGFRYAPKFVDGEAVAVQGVRNLIKFEIKEG